ncbi:hypothetical protein MishRS11D_13070 [Methylomagnum ishizawai]|nr:hypothetical protein MishRS11D_13070 [Methylomagnum ishizawai]
MLGKLECFALYFIRVFRLLLRILKLLLRQPKRFSLHFVGKQQNNQGRETKSRIKQSADEITNSAPLVDPWHLEVVKTISGEIHTHHGHQKQDRKRKREQNY